MLDFLGFAAFPFLPSLDEDEDEGRAAADSAEGMSAASWPCSFSSALMPGIALMSALYWSRASEIPWIKGLVTGQSRSRSLVLYLLARLNSSGRIAVVFADVDKDLALELGDVDTSGVR